MADERAQWSTNRHLADRPDRLYCLAEEIGLSANLFKAMLYDAETGRALAATAEEAFHRGAFGVPTFFVGTQMFWGNDRLMILKHVLKKWSSQEPERELE